uniref:Dynein light chain n=1 Tax=Steinernema glaseri TaxID=37863 RepID=A0A1I7YLT8_9BILA
MTDVDISVVKSSVPVEQRNFAVQCVSESVEMYGSNQTQVLRRVAREFCDKFGSGWQCCVDREADLSNDDSICVNIGSLLIMIYKNKRSK